ncbi:MAG: phosphatidylglycerol lysyltransferase domain-containing protein [Prolixibacteraceae bacterium]
MSNKLKIPVFIRNKYFWQSSMVLLAVIFMIFFIRNEQVELIQIKKTIAGANLPYLMAGFAVFILYLFLQAYLYVWSFKSLQQKLSFWQAMDLFLKRNLIGVFVPGGTISSLAFFNKDLDKQKLSKTQQYLGSYIFAFASTASILIVAIPAFILLFARNELNKLEIVGFIIIALVIVLFGTLLYSLLQKKQGWGYRLIKKYKAEWLILLDEIAEQTVSRSKLIQTLFLSVAIEIIGVVHLYISLLALNATASFEVAFTGYVVMIILLSISPFLKGLGAIEISLTYLLIQFGYSKALAASITLLFRFFEFWLPLLAGVLVFVFRRDGLLARILPTLIILLLGITNIISVLSPAIPSRLALIHEWLPQQITEISNFTVLIFGLGLILISVYLFFGSKNAWRIALFLTTMSIAGHLTKAVDYEEALLAFAALISLLITKKSYTLKSQLSSSRKSIYQLFIPVLIAVVYSVAGFYLINKVHFKKEFDFAESLHYFIRTLVIYNDTTILPITKFGHDFLISVRVLGAAIFIYILWYLFKPGRFYSSQNVDERKLAIDLMQAYGHSRLDYFKVYFDKLFFFNQEKTGFISYRIAENYAVVLEDPVAADANEEFNLIEQFNQYCSTSGLIVVYYRVPAESLEKYERLGFSTVLIGQEAIVNLETFTMAGSAKHPLRNAIKRIQSAGYVSKTYEPPLKDGLLQKLKQVSHEWLQEHHGSEIVFTQGVFNEDELRSTTIITIENNDEKVIAFLNLITDPTKKEGTLDLMRKIQQTPNGIMDFIFIKMFEHFKALGYEKVNLGLAPLAGFQKGHTIKQQASYYIVEYLKKNSRFKGLYDYKEKFEPLWSDRYLVYQNTSDLLKLPLILAKISKL